jgi:hypothetical protein
MEEAIQKRVGSEESLGSIEFRISFREVWVDGSRRV